MNLEKLNVIDENDDYLYDPMAYDAMRELANRVTGRYIVWERETTGLESKHWQEERIKLRLDLRTVDPDSKSAVEAKTAELREMFRNMPKHAPALA